MAITSKYSDMNWVEALKPKVATVVSNQETSETIDNVLEKTMAATFSTPKTWATNKDRVADASVVISKKIVNDNSQNEINSLKSKLASRNIDPVSLGVVKKEEWDSIKDYGAIERIAKESALQYEKYQSKEWERNAQAWKPTSLGGYDPKTSRGQQIVSSKSTLNEFVNNYIQVPKNAASILDPKRLEKLALEPNERDVSIAKNREDRKLKESTKRQDNFKSDIPEGYKGLHNVIQHSASIDDKSAQKTYMPSLPKNQISMLDNIDPKSTDLKSTLASLFSRVPDPKELTREANKKHKESITRKDESKENRADWDRIKPTVSTSSITDRFLDILAKKKES